MVSCTISQRHDKHVDFSGPALIACTILHWITMPEAQDVGEHGTPQALGIGFDKESATVVATSQSSSSNRAPSDAPHFGLKEVL